MDTRNFCKISLETIEQLTSSGPSPEEVYPFPGIVGLQCSGTNRIFILAADNCGVVMGSMLYAFNHDDLGQEVLRDMRDYGLSSFSFVLLAFGPEFQDTKKRDEKFTEFRNEFKDLLY